jgi:anti-sigma-K factor RskA
MKPARPHPHTLTGAYALNALTGAQAARFERHLARCPACAQEISEFTETTARLAAAAAAQPPAALRRRVLATATHARRLPPALREPVADFPRRRWLALPAAAVLLALAATVAVATRLGGDPAARSQARDSQIAAVLTAPDATMLDTSIATGGTATVVMSLRRHTLVFAATGLVSLPTARCYELWLIGPRGDTPAGMLPGPQHGPTGPVTSTGLRSGSRLGLSVEPAGGSPHPTTTMILNLAL